MCMCMCVEEGGGCGCVWCVDACVCVNGCVWAGGDKDSKHN